MKKEGTLQKRKRKQKSDSGTIAGTPRQPATFKKLSSSIQERNNRIYAHSHSASPSSSALICSKYASIACTSGYMLGNGATVGANTFGIAHETVHDQSLPYHHVISSIGTINDDQLCSWNIPSTSTHYGTTQGLPLPGLEASNIIGPSQTTLAGQYETPSIEAPITGIPTEV
ncbi:unnamed protein product [Gongylonema pulchrum]|uniref:Ovule protein n=1 Tax=Gongylonema pulchrum TaxID=637853 RepID=A0A183D404_9BILA|nr:unnamed protein product [Gongylonema pulchrum]